MKFDGLGLAVETPAKALLTHPINQTALVDADGKQAYVEILSYDSREAQQLAQAATNRRIKVRGGAGTVRLTAEELEQERVDVLAALTRGWYLLSLDGTPIADATFTTANARELYAHPSTRWIREQVELGAGDRSLFTKAPSTD